MSMNVRAMVSSDEECWDRYVRESPSSSCYHLAAWRRVIEDSFGHKTFYLFSEDGAGRMTGVLPMAHLKSLLFGNFMVSLPYFNYGGICADDDESYFALLKEATRLARNEGAAHVEFREQRLIENALLKKESKVSMLLPLPQSQEVLWESLGSKLRSQIKRPEKEGMYYRIGREDMVDDFYEVFSQNMRDLGTPVYSKSLFSNILKNCPSSSWICSIYSKEGKPVSSGFLVGFKETLEIPWASSLRAYNSHAPNMLLYWACLKYSCECGYKRFDFGRSTPNEGTYRFKEQWGAKAHQLFWYYWMPQGSTLPELNPQNPKFSAAINVWRKLPVTLTKLIGPMVVKNLP